MVGSLVQRGAFSSLRRLGDLTGGPRGTGTDVFNISTSINSLPWIMMGPGASSSLSSAPPVMAGRLAWS